MKEEIQKFWKGDIEDGDEAIKKYSRDASLFVVIPKLVLFPKDSTDVENLVKWANENKTKYPDLSITARSAGTCMAGGPLNNSIIIDFTRYMHQIVGVSPVDPYNMKPMFFGSAPVTISGVATVEPGCYYRDFEKATLEHDLLLPCFTASKSINALGGMVGNNSAGELTLRYGKTEDYIKELEVVFSDGHKYAVRPLNKKELYAKIAQGDFEGDIYKNIFQLINDNSEIIKKAKPIVTKNSAGYYLWNVWDEEKEIFDLSKLIVGSQGTLAIATKINLRLVQVKKESAMVVVFLKSLDNLGEMVDDALLALPETVEAYDDKTIKLALKFWYGFIKKRGLWGAIKLGFSFIPEMTMLFTGVPKLVLLVECAGDSKEEVRNRIDVLYQKMKKYPNAKARKVFSKSEAEKYWTIRHDSFALLREHFQGKQTAPFIDDVIVPAESLPEFFPKVKKILDDNKLIYNIHGHAANGNFHLIPLLDLKHKFDPDFILNLADQVYSLVLSYHGSIDAEHNDGIIRTPFLEQMYGEKVYSLFEKTKQIFDPQNILNPGKKVGGSREYIREHIIK